MKYIGRIVSSTIGLVLIAVGIIIFVIVNRTIYDEFDKAAVLIPNNGADKIVDPYLRFIGNEGDKHNIRTYTFGVYNLTNPVETMGGALPKYEEVGPYTYEYIYERMNPTFSEDEEVLSFKLWKRYNVLLTEGSRDPNADTIYHFNLAYAAALAKTGGELQLSIALTAAAMGKIFTSLTDKSFKQQALVAAAPKVLGLSWQQLVVASSGSTTNACAAWLANTNPSAIPFSILLASPVIGTPSADFTVALCEKLFTPTNDYSIINADIYLDYAIASPALLAKLVAAGFSNEDAALVIKYQQFERDNYVPAALISSKALPECSNVTVCTQPASFGLLQWGQAGGLLQNMSVYDVPGSGLAGVPEFGIVTASSLSLQQAAALSNPASTLNLVTPTSIGTILTIAQKIAAGQTVPAQAYSPYTLPEFLQIAKYTSYIMQTFVDKAIIQDQIFANFQGGPITKHTVHNFLFNVTDPLLSLLTPGAASSSPLSNIRDRAVANATGHTDSVHTGVGDIDLVSAPITFQGEDVLVYNKNITVSGAFGEQLPPNFLFKHPDSQVHAFTEEYARSLTFTKEIGGNFKGIPFLRYRVDDSNWQPNEDYFQTIPFLMNLTSVKGGAPAFLSRPRLKGLNVGYYYKAGLTDLVNNDEDLDVFADYEPRSGKAIQGRYSLQVNGYISGNDGENSPVYNKYTTIKSDVIHPMFWGASIIGATQEQVDILVKAYKVDSFRYAITVILIVVGGFLSMVAVGLFVLEKIIDV